MSPEPNQSTPDTPEADSAESSKTVPMWLIILLFLALYWGALYFDHRGGWFNAMVYAPYRSLAELEAWQPVGTGPSPRGREVYQTTCALCHGNEGEGKPNQAPPLVGAEFVLGSPARLIRIPLNGLDGPIMVKGERMTFPSSMPAMGAALSDEDLAAALTYMRMSWGNQGDAITPEQVAAVRAEVGTRTQPWTEQELKQIQ
jgi:mono/diheme cytochrome c family protein